MSAAQEYDLVVVGSGGGALMTAVRAADAGLRVLVLEKSELFGGTTAYSGGVLWIPCNYDQAGNGVQDHLKTAFSYVKRVAKGLSPDERILAYVEAANSMMEYLRDGVGQPYHSLTLYPDYYQQIEGSIKGGRSMDPARFDASKLGLEGLKTMRDGNKTALVLGHICVTAKEAGKVVRREKGGMWMMMGIMARYYLDLPWRLKTSRDRSLSGGQALIAALLTAARARSTSITMQLQAPMTELLSEDGKVVGVTYQKNGQSHTVRSRFVMLAAGGFEQNQQMREQYLPQPTNTRWSHTPKGNNTGDGILAAQKLGAQTALMDKTWGAPSISVPGEDENRVVFMERNFPHSMVVNGKAERFTNESQPYPEFQQDMFKSHQAGGKIDPAWFVFDATFRKRYPIGPLLPGESFPDAIVAKKLKEGFFVKAGSIAELAQKIGLDAAALEKTVVRFNGFARTGVDEDFGRGNNAFDNYYSDPAVTPNSNLGALETAPYYAVKFFPGDIGTKGGLVTDIHARVLGADGQAIAGLYATGNTSAAVMGPAYAGAGSTIGPAMTFGFRAVADMVGQPMALKNTDWLGLEV
ncbi:MAG: FAD-dependent oxidoreductase [Brachymonas sp.]|jgi:3-oxosteroid 1-dehydrogenase